MFQILHPEVGEFLKLACHIKEHKCHLFYKWAETCMYSTRSLLHINCCVCVLQKWAVDKEMMACEELNSLSPVTQNGGTAKRQEAGEKV